jgi:hypothetical protein
VCVIRGKEQSRGLGLQMGSLGVASVGSVHAGYGNICSSLMQSVNSGSREGYHNNRAKNAGIKVYVYMYSTSMMITFRFLLIAQYGVLYCIINPNTERPL